MPHAKNENFICNSTLRIARETEHAAAFCGGGQLNSILNNMDTAIYVSDLKTDEILYVNAGMSKLYNQPLTGRICWDALYGFEERCEFCPIGYLQKNAKQCCKWEHYNANLGRHFKRRDCLIHWTDGELAHLEYADDITEVKASQKRLEISASTDLLTSALNRTAFIRGLTSILKSMEEHPEPLTLAFIDIDGLKSVNDNYGHAAGDTLIIDVACTLRANIRDRDIVGRYGGDEFVVAFVKCPKKYAAKRMRKALRQLEDTPERNPGAPVPSFSYGLVESTEIPYTTPEVYIARLIDIADKRMLERKIAKSARINSYQTAYDG